jgi:ferredoxin--NADP+ reductase
VTPGSADRPLRVAVIGAGPAGFFSTKALLDKSVELRVTVDIFDMLPAPYGLVRYGVAPDHAKIKRVAKGFAATAADDRVRFFGNVEFGRDLTLDEVLGHYDQVLFTHGAQSDRSMGIPGEHLAGSYSATELVAWYNGHPGYCDRHFNLSVSTALIVGVGNVAMDAARILAKSADELATTDIADHALEVLRESEIEDIYVIGRRGPVQAKFTTPELEEIAGLDNADAIVLAGDLELDELSERHLAESKLAQRNLRVLERIAEQGTAGKPRRVHLRFLTSPVAILGDDRVDTVELVRNDLRPTETDYLQAHATGEFEMLPCGLVLRSVGYEGVALPGVPYTRHGTVPHREGRVVDDNGDLCPRQYVAGWAKRGPSGVIGTNKADAKETVEHMIEDAATVTGVADDAADLEAIPDLLRDKGVRFITFAQWQLVDEHEIAEGKRQGRPRVKVVDTEEMLRIAGVAQ